MKKQSIMIIGGLIAALACLAAFLFPIGDGLVRTSGALVEAFPGYDFIFTNDAAAITKEASGAMIGAWVLLVIGSVFSVFGLLLPLTGATKFPGFIDIVAGLCLLVTGVLFLLAPVVIGLPSVANGSYALGYGFMAGAIAALLGAVIEIALGVLGFTGKKA